MIDQVGSGIRRMFQTQRDRYFPLPDFVFEVTEQGTRVEVAILGQVLDVVHPVADEARRFGLAPSFIAGQGASAHWLLTMCVN
jgi:hypothetical protein